MKYLLSYIFLSLVITNLYANTEEYYDAKEYIKLSNQEENYKEFKKLVKEDAVALKNKNKKVKIVMVYPANQISDYWRKSKIYN